MANLILPAQTDIALALREPNLLVPGKKPVGPVVPYNDKVKWEQIHLFSNRVNLVTGNNIEVGTGSSILAGDAVTNGSSTVRLDTKTPEDFPLVGIVSGVTTAQNGWRRLAFSSFGDLGKYAGIYFQINPNGNFVVTIGDNTGYDAGDRREWATNTVYSGTLRYTTAFRIDSLTQCTMYINGVRQTLTPSGTAPAYAKGTLPGAVGGVFYSSTWYHSAETVSLAAFGSGRISDAQLAEASLNPYQALLKPANDAPYLISVPTGGGTYTLTAATETDDAIALGKAKTKALALAEETDAAQALTANKARAITLATETGEAQALGRAKRKLIEPALETDTAQPVSFLGQIIQAITPALEAETAVALGKAKAKAIGIATETDEAITLTFSGAKAIEPALETGEAIALGKAKRKAISPALETDEALPVSLTLAVALSAALETDAALALGKAKRKAIEPAVESDTAMAVTLFRETTLVQADIDAIADAVYTKLVSEGLVQKLLELWQLQGLDIANPMTVTPTTRQVDAISLALTGDGVTTTTVTRQ